MTVRCETKFEPKNQITFLYPVFGGAEATPFQEIYTDASLLKEDGNLFLVGGTRWALADAIWNDIEDANPFISDARLTGDNRTWGRGQAYPIRKSVRAFAAKNRYRFVADRATWILIKRNLTPGEHWSNFINLIRDLARGLKRIYRR